MWEELYKYMKFLESAENHRAIEMTQELYDFCREIGFVTEDGYVKFQGKTFCLG